MRGKKKLNHTKTNQLSCFPKQLTGFYTTQASTERYLQTDYNGTCQGIKRKILVKAESYSEPCQRSETAPFPKNSQRLKRVN